MRPPLRLYYSLFGGHNARHTDVLRQDSQLLELMQAQNVIPDPLGQLATRDGFSYVRASQISGTPAITGMSHLLRDVADRFILSGSNGKVFEDDANPPVAKVGGTDFTTGADNLTRMDVHEQRLIIVSRQRDLPQTINSSGTKADLGGTPPRGLDYKVYGRYGHMFSPLYAGTTYYEMLSFNSAVDDHDIWANPVTTNFLNFGRPGSGVQVVGGEVHADHLMVYTQDKVFPVYTTPLATLPFAFQKEIFAEEGGGPVGAHALQSGNASVYWLSQNMSVKRQVGFVVQDIGWPIQPFLRGLNDSRRQYAVAGWEPKYRMVLWAVSDGSDTQHQDVIGLQVDTGHYYLFTLQVNALASRKVSEEQRIIGGHYNGRFSNLFDGSTTGDLQDATAVIDADTISPRLHLGLPGVRKKVPYFAVFFDPIGAESVTVQIRLDDDTAWTSPSGSPIAMSGTDLKRQFFPIPRPFENLAVRIRDNNSGERYRVTKLGFPTPTAVSTN